MLVEANICGFVSISWKLYLTGKSQNKYLIFSIWYTCILNKFKLVYTIILWQLTLSFHYTIDVYTFLENKHNAAPCIHCCTFATYLLFNGHKQFENHLIYEEAFKNELNCPDLNCGRKSVFFQWLSLYRVLFLICWNWLSFAFYA